MREAFDFYLGGTDAALERGQGFLALDVLTIADISFACDLAQFLRERFMTEALDRADLEPIAGDAARTLHRASFDHLQRLLALPAFAAPLEPYMAQQPRSVAP